MTLPRISIITPSYNQARFLPATIASVLGQGYPDLEYIIQDGGSTDGTRAILEELPHQVAWVSERDGGQADAVNRGWARATGEVLGWVNSDDVYEPGALQRVGEVFAANPDLDWVIGRCRIIDAEGGEIRHLVTRYKNFLLDHLSLSLLLVENFISQMAVFVRRRALDAVGPLRTDLHWVMDYELWLRLMRRSPPQVIPAYLACFRMYGGTKSIDGFRGQFAEEHAISRLHAREVGLPLLVPLHWIAAWKTVTAYRLVTRLRPL